MDLRKKGESIFSLSESIIPGISSLNFSFDFIIVLYLFLVIHISAPFKGEALGGGSALSRLGKIPLTRLPLNPEKARRLVETYTPTSGSLAESMSRRFPLEIYLCIELLLRLTLVIYKLILTFILLKFDNSSSPQTIKFFNGSFTFKISQ